MLGGVLHGVGEVGVGARSQTTGSGEMLANN